MAIVVETGPVGRSLTEGKRTKEGTPCDFPLLSIEACRLLRGINNAANSIESAYWDGLPPSDLMGVVDVTKSLLACPGERRKFRLASLDLLNPRGKYPGLKMFLSPIDNKPNDQKATVVFSPNTRRSFRRNGKPITQLEGATINLARDMLSFGRPAESVCEIIESFEEAYPRFEVTYGAAQLEIEFREGKMVKAWFDPKSNRLDQSISYGLAVAKLSVGESQQVEVPLSLADFCGPKPLITQTKIDDYLQVLTFELAEKAKPFKKAK